MKRMWIIFYGILMLLIVGCAQPNIKVSQDFWQNKQKQIGVVIVAPEPAQTYRYGGEGLVDMAINNAITGGLRGYVKTLQPNNFMTISDMFVYELNKKGINAKKLNYTLNLEDYKNSDGKVDLRVLSDKEKIDTLIVFNIFQWGTNRKYGMGIIPLEAPKAYFSADGYMFDLNSSEPVNLKTKNSLWAKRLRDYKICRRDIPSPWEQEPNYENLTTALNENMENIKKMLYDDFFDFNTKNIK